jgi:hypothetical protein
LAIRIGNLGWAGRGIQWLADTSPGSRSTVLVQRFSPKAPRQMNDQGFSGREDGPTSGASTHSGSPAAAVSAAIAVAAVDASAAIAAFVAGAAALPAVVSLH